jgi:hypothetical protein
MGHLIGDASQPLHTTIHHHGWVGDNPHNYTTSRGFHSWIDGGFFNKTGGANLAALKSKLRPAQLVSINGRPAKPEETFQVAFSSSSSRTNRSNRSTSWTRTASFPAKAKRDWKAKRSSKANCSSPASCSATSGSPPGSKPRPIPFSRAQLARRKRAARRVGEQVVPRRFCSGGSLKGMAFLAPLRSCPDSVQKLKDSRSCRRQSAAASFWPIARWRNYPA